MLHKPQKYAHTFFRQAALVTVLTVGINYSAQADVVTSIRPLGFIAAAVADGVTDTQVLLPDGASPHDYALRPSDIRKLNQADLVVWIGPDMETFLAKPIEKIAQNKQLELAGLPTIKPLLLKNSEDEHDSNESNQHKHETDHEHHHHGQYNMHIWLSPEIAEKAAQAIYSRLVEQYPQQKQQLEVNLRKFNGQLVQTNKNISHILQPVLGQGYFVFHDAYGYFEKHYQLSPLGVFTVNPEIQPGAQRLHYIRTQLVEQKAKCIFAEPQFRPAVIHAVAKGTNVRIGTLDPLGSGIVLNKDSYMKFITQLSEQYLGCLN
ncbi:zinc ABC transporter substrate-binding protein ZnuA [Xenorhabdus cabanillasii]|uniref:High-affinity zinc uptake system protein ZnuA n=2 Tax=Xenorhabdus cabanillasii TaxID=351673 RepID=A0A3D9UP16_9GAMM|nr:zinc ABC transporter substrate-binding protein ZnuA [Xenorhabdus cabanillasii]PHM76370.1 zinc ABC transporter substrate-binding protein ZnuA [Xenorhabdus cabanillasii JM26]REF28385.1 zinc transport system substrate-binding protein [Xenorhabdus cabanillasii]CDL87475.1 High-affinity zinc uptake system protein znuA [Xenorhabdus cabanillasii JM26]